MRYWSRCSALAAMLFIGIAFLKPAQSATRHRAPHKAQAAARKSVPKMSAAKHSAAKAPRAAAKSVSGGRHGRQNARLRRAVLRSRRHHLSLEEPQTQATIAEIPLTPAKLALVRPLKGSRESLIRQNTRADADGLERIEDDADLDRLVHAHELVALPASERLYVNPSLEANRRYCRPWTSRFLSDMAAAHYQRFKRPLQVNSAVRTVAYQRQLVRINGNAAPAGGDIASPHLTGATIDIGKKGLSLSEIGWIRAYLLPLQQAGRIDVEEEFAQACFHISVYKNYVPALELHNENDSKPFIASKVR